MDLGSQCEKKHDVVQVPVGKFNVAKRESNFRMPALYLPMNTC